MKNAKPILIMQLRPEDSIADSEYGCFLKYGAMPAEDTVRLRLEKSGIPEYINLDDYSAILVGGSPFDISTPADQKSDIQKKIETDFNRLMDDVVTRDFPFLGACSGCGLLGNYTGTPITRKYGEPVSCVRVSVIDSGRDDKLLSGFPDEIDVLLGHKEALDKTPDEATLLVTGKNCPVQMFRVGQNVYATQFHPEGDAHEFSMRIDTYKNHGYFEPHEADALKQNVSRRPTPYAQEILKRFVDTYYRDAT